MSYLLFDVPITGEKHKQASKPADVKINRVNREVAKDRYYWHRQLGENFMVIAADRKIITDYQSFMEIPVGQERYAIGKLIGMGYEIQFKLFNDDMHTSHQAKLLDNGFTIYQGCAEGTKLFIKAKTPDNHNWHTIEKDFKSIAALKRRLKELDKLEDHIDLHDTKNTISVFKM